MFRSFTSRGETFIRAGTKERRESEREKERERERERERKGGVTTLAIKRARLGT